MALENLNFPTYREIVCALSEEELIEFARNAARSDASSSAYAGITLSVDNLFRNYLALYRRWREEDGKTPLK